MVLKLYGSYRSPWVRLVAAILIEKEVPYELIPVDISKGENKSPEYLAHHPFGQVPYIDDNGFILYESRAICYYIASKYASQGIPLLPNGVEANALYQQAVFVEASHFFSHVMGAARETYFRQKRGLEADKVAFDKEIADLSGKLDVYEKILSKQKYLIGDEISLVDFYHLPGAQYLSMLGSNVMESKPNVAKWYKDVSSRHSWVSAQDKN